ncbi:hypothetical protein SBDP1_890016 [Syntrophobacter sp. SbD1]|nr:hypothetical protein SBDP1_890016 [Syntrophobacter sp. SbD1]
MAKIKTLRMKQVTTVSGERILVPYGPSGCIKWVAYQRVPGEREMNADLVGPSRFDPYLQQ